MPRLGTHVSFADPYCPELRPLAAKATVDAGVDVRDSGTVVVIEGPRFSTRAESIAYSDRGCHVINMTQHPEAALAREAEICFVNISLITDYDPGFTRESGIEPVNVADVVATFRSNNEKLVDVLCRMIAAIPSPDQATCGCMTALAGAQL